METRENLRGSGILLSISSLPSPYGIGTLGTVSYTHLLAKRNPKSLTICTLLDKPERRVVDDVNVDYVGFVIPRCV